MPLKRRAACEGGFTMTEVLVAVIMLALIALATFQLMDVGTRTTFRAEESQSMLNVAQRELEELRELSYEELALTAAPDDTITDPDDPRSRVEGTNFDAGQGSNPNPAALVINGGSLEEGGTVSGGVVDPGPTPFTSGDISGDVYRFVVWQDDPSCLDADCPGTQDQKRAVVAVRVDETSTLSVERPYEELASNFIDPQEAVNDVDSSGSGGDVVTGQQFYLSDTPCSDASGDPTRLTPTDHTSHDTTGTCGNTEKPDALMAGAAPEDPNSPPLRDYATDLEYTGDPNYCNPLSDNCYPNDAGLQLQRPDVDGCDYSPGGTNEHQVVHRWVSRKMPAAFQLTGKATLELFTRTIDDLAASGKICVYLFTRTVDAEGVPTDTMLVDLDNSPNAYFTYTDASWPAGSWTSVKLQMNFDPATIALDDRLGFAITVERAGTAPDLLQFAYDHPDYESRLEVLTTTPLG